MLAPYTFTQSITDLSIKPENKNLLLENIDNICDLDQDFLNQP